MKQSAAGSQVRKERVLVEVRVASVDDLPKSGGLRVEANGKQIAVFRHQGQFWAIEDECPHKGGSLHEGAVQEGVVSCPWHQWQFDIRTGISPVNPLSKVRTYSTRVQGTDLLVTID
jgi:nitrite reductase/ring-hydroxylating ferredoxin subunit